METLRYVLLANGLLAVVSIAYYVLLRRETFFGANRLALWLGLAAAVVLPLLELPDWRPQPVRKVMQRTAQVIIPKVLPKSLEPDVTITDSNNQIYRIFPPRPAAFMWSWQVVLIMFYWAGVLALLVRFGVQLVSLRRLIKGSERDEYDDFTLLRNDRITSPFSFFGWVILNPDHYTKEELEQILRHERVHVRARHSLDMIGAELVCIALWFNPAAYLFRHLIHQTLEFSADRAVLAEGVDAKAYQYNLVKVSLSGEKSRLVNTFSGPTLRHRIGMINRKKSNSTAWGRYVCWALLMGTMALACQHLQSSEGSFITKTTSPFPLTNATRVLAAELDKAGMPWFRQSTLLENVKYPDTIRVKGRLVHFSAMTYYPKMVCLQNNHLALKIPEGQQVKLFVNGREASPQSLSTLTFEEVNDLLVYQKWDDAPGAEKFQESFRIFISTTHKTPRIDPIRTRWKQYLQAASISDYPLGVSNTFSMNKLLEATFFNNKLAFVKRTKDDYLTLYDEYTADIDTYINGIPVTPKRIEGVHVREVDKLYTRERSFEEWANGPNRQHRFILYIQTTPKRAKRDSSYYVFSPFYTGDF